MKKKVISLLAVMALTVGTLAGCGSSATNAPEGTKDAVSTETTAETTTQANAEAGATAGLKAGFIFLHDENSTYDLNFMNAAKEACENLGVE